MNANCVTFALKATDQGHLISDNLRTQQTSICCRKTRSEAFFFSPRTLIRYQNRNAVFTFTRLRDKLRRKTALFTWPLSLFANRKALL